jgi:hypothetical protein
MTVTVSAVIWHVMLCTLTEVHPSFQRVLLCLSCVEKIGRCKDRVDKGSGRCVDSKSTEKGTGP